MPATAHPWSRGLGRGGQSLDAVPWPAHAAATTYRTAGDGHPRLDPRGWREPRLEAWRQRWALPERTKPLPGGGCPRPPQPFVRPARQLGARRGCRERAGRAPGSALGK